MRARNKIYEFLVNPYFSFIISASFISGASTPLGMNFVFLSYVDLKYVLLFFDNSIVFFAFSVYNKSVGNRFSTNK